MPFLSCWSGCTARKRPRPPTDNFDIPGRAALLAGLRSTGQPWQAGPYGTRARDLLARHAADLRALLAAYDELAGQVRATGGPVAITHGGPDAANVLKTPAGLVFVDWESALLAPPECDLWALAESDPGLLDAYRAATGTAIDALALHRMWYDLAEISLYVRWFRSSHHAGHRGLGGRHPQARQARPRRSPDGAVARGHDGHPAAPGLVHHSDAG